MLRVLRRDAAWLDAPVWRGERVAVPVALAAALPFPREAPWGRSRRLAPSDADSLASLLADSFPLAASLSVPSLPAAVASAFASGLDSAFDSSFSAASRLRFASLSDLKSVSYQPPPFRRKAGADTSLLRRRLPHEGHLMRGASVIFCITSV